MITVHGLKNCDTCRKALKWLTAEGRDHRFHDLRADGLDAAMIDRWSAAVGWQILLNRRSTTWRKLPDSDTADVTEARAKTLMLAQPALIKRPIFEIPDGRVIVGFKVGVTLWGV